mmetsp:Transcript_5320/g.11174  ORF Transcript_5320/g.11174 Transcript_5320/m.11174 type:complete len:286 (-) Transcript_5320:1899-2756(-)
MRVAVISTKESCHGALFVNIYDVASPDTRSIDIWDALFSKDSLDSSGKLFDGVLGISEKHVGIVLDKDGIIDSGISGGQGTLHHDNLLRVPHPQHGHSSNLRVGIVFGGRVDGIVGSDHEGDVGLVKVVVDFFQFFHNVVRDTRFGQQNVELTGHSSGDGMNREANRFSVLDEGIGQFLEWVLGLGDSQSVSGNDNDLFGIGEELNGLVDVGHGGFTLELDGLAATSGLGSISSENDTGDVTIHGIAHDLGKGGTGTSDQGSYGCHDGHIQHESLGTECPSGVTV